MRRRRDIAGAGSSWRAILRNSDDLYDHIMRYMKSFETVAKQTYERHLAQTLPIAGCSRH